MEINLSNQGIYNFPREYCFQKNITSLMLENNNLRELPKEIINLKNLKKLNLSNNNIIFNIHQEKWIKQLQKNGCLIYNNKDTSNKVNIRPSSIIEKVRVHDIAKELNIASKDVLKKASVMGLEVKSAQSTVTMEQAEGLSNFIITEKNPARSPKIVKKTVAQTKSTTSKKENKLKIIDVNIFEDKSLKIVKKRFEKFVINRIILKSILPMGELLGQRKIILVYEQEVSSLNLTLIEYQNDDFMVIDNVSNAYGLNEITKIMEEFINYEIENENGLIMGNLKTSDLDEVTFNDNRVKIREASINTIKLLEVDKETIIKIDDLILENYSTFNISVELSRNEFNDEIINFRKITIDMIKAIISKNNYTAANIDYIIGNDKALNIPSIENSLHLTFARDIYKSTEKIISLNKE